MMEEWLKEYLRTMQHKLTRFTGTTDVRMSIFGWDGIIQPEEVEISVFSSSRPPSQSKCPILTLKLGCAAKKGNIANKHSLYINTVKHIRSLQGRIKKSKSLICWKRQKRQILFTIRLASLAEMS